MSQPVKYRISLKGCDDTTKVDIELTEEEAALVRRLCEQSEAASTYGCQPTMEIAPYLPAMDEDEEQTA